MLLCSDSDIAEIFILILQRSHPSSTHWFLSLPLCHFNKIFHKISSIQGKKKINKKILIMEPQEYLCIGTLGGMSKITSLTKHIYHNLLDLIARLLSQWSLFDIFLLWGSSDAGVDIFGLAIPSFTLANSTKYENSPLKLSFLHIFTLDF